VADPRFANIGAKVERRRREDRGAEGAEGVEFGEGYPLPNDGTVWGGAIGRGHCPVPRKFFDFESENGDF